MSKILKNVIFCRKKTAGGIVLNLKQKLAAAAGPAAAAARPPKAAARPEKAAGRPAAGRSPGGRREAKIRGVPKMLPEPLGGSGGSP